MIFIPHTKILHSHSIPDISGRFAINFFSTIQNQVHLVFFRWLICHRYINGRPPNDEEVPLQNSCRFDHRSHPPLMQRSSVHPV